MTTRAGGRVDGVIEFFAGAPEYRRIYNAGAVVPSAIVIGSAPPIYKNQGWYAAGGVWESWVSTPLPSTFPPSSHTLTELTYIILQA